ncbi:sensor histidine kinase [Polaribacter litorisediminis]|uniref:sensor histidine kinase n=1 Tax=Polaribacter litorisediminis TaxID=1908341 RepID=UPI001CBB8784|nr:sensor histidine kinase [Polaribacter litorisediminis]UAM97459.1 sensor histidine kinase [Polaribacter litorisediminis]
MKYWVVSFLFSLGIYFNSGFLWCQLPLEKAYQNDKNFVVIDSTIVRFINLPKDEIIALEKRAKDYEKTLDNLKDRYKKAALYHYIIHANLTLKNSDVALSYLYKLLQIPGLKDSKGAIDVYWGIFNIYRYSGNTPNMLEQFSDLRRLGKKYNYYKETEPENLDKVYAEILIRAGYYKEAKKIYLQKLIKDSLLFEPVRTAIIYNDLATIFIKLSALDSAKIYQKKAVQVINSKRKDGYLKGYRPYIKDYILLQQYWNQNNFSVDNLKFARKFLLNAHSNFYGEIHTAVFANHFISTYYFKNSEYQKALTYINDAIFVGSEKLSINNLSNLYNLKSRILDALGKNKEADETLFKFEFIRDSVNSKNRNLDLAKYQVNKILKEQEIISQKASESENKYKTVVISTVFILILLVITTISLLIMFQNRKKLKDAKNQIDQKLNESKILLKELNHRVKNNLSLIISLIKFQSEEIEDVFYLEKFKHLENRISAIVIAHEQFIYSENNILGKSYNLEEYLDKIFNSLISLSSRKIEYKQFVDNIHVTIDTALPIGILMNELISNSLEHAKTNDELKIDLKIIYEKSWITILYKDSGEGFIIKDNNRSLGLFIINSMVEQLEGKIVRDGSTYKIKLKKKL